MNFCIDIFLHGEAKNFSIYVKQHKYLIVIIIIPFAFIHDENY